MDREKVIKELEERIKVAEECMGNPMFTPDAIRTIVALLKEQGHGETFTVIDTKTGKEADEYEIALHEDWAKHLCYCDMEGWAIENDGTLLLVDECGQFAYADRERFKVVFDA